jgi:sterol desaturase/sphingolipid hydroxylase (fatty acid hydroxylase superfamily)
MPDSILSHEPIIRLAAFAGILAGMAAWEVLAPRRDLHARRLRRWPNNLAIVVLDTLLVRLAFPLTAVGLALLAETRGWGLFNAFAVPGWLAIPLAVILLDLAIYLQHVLFHAVPLLWRLHRVHHADPGFDVTTGVRFHPFEIALSVAIKLAVVLVLGAPAVAVVLFEILLNATSLFNHGNVRLPLALDRVLRPVRRDSRYASRAPLGAR